MRHIFLWFTIASMIIGWAIGLHSLMNGELKLAGIIGSLLVFQIVFLEILLRVKKK